MLIKNLTSETIMIQVETLRDGLDYDIYIAPFGVSDLSGVILLHQEKLEGKIMIDDSPVESLTPSILEEKKETKEEVNEDQEELKEESTEEVEGQFVCDVCKAEFGSARGLAAHKSRAHSE